MKAHARDRAHADARFLPSRAGSVPELPAGLVREGGERHENMCVTMLEPGHLNL